MKQTGISPAVIHWWSTYPDYYPGGLPSTLFSYTSTTNIPVCMARPYKQPSLPDYPFFGVCAAFFLAATDRLRGPFVFAAFPAAAGRSALVRFLRLHGLAVMMLQVMLQLFLPVSMLLSWPSSAYATQVPRVVPFRTRFRRSYMFSRKRILSSAV